MARSAYGRYALTRKFAQILGLNCQIPSLIWVAWCANAAPQTELDEVRHTQLPLVLLRTGVRPFGVDELDGLYSVVVLIRNE